MFDPQVVLAKHLYLAKVRNGEMRPEDSTMPPASATKKL
jgi:hypothetical protein